MCEASWREGTLESLVTLQRGFDITKDEQRTGPYFVISSSGPSSKHAEYKVEGPGVVIGRKGSLGTVFFSADDFWPHDTTLWVKDFHGNDPKFCYYFLKTMHLERFDCGASNPTLNRNHVHQLPIRFPEWDKQIRIASILSVYDDLIENNTQRIKILEEMAQMIYREWFVNFRFPGHENGRMVDSELGKIPQGWKPSRLGAFCAETRRAVDPRQVDPETPYVGLEHIPRKSVALGEWGRAGGVASTKLRFNRGEILFGKIRPYFHKVAVAPVDGVASSDAIVIVPTEPRFFAPVLCCVSSEDFVAEATQTSQGTKMPRANWDVLLKYPLPLPQGELLDRFNSVVEPMFGSIQNLSLRNRNLRATRDFLLPKLISGEIPVESAEDVAGEYLERTA
jgi:type I restriction enzyme S subunit